MTNIILLGHLVVDSRVWEVPLFLMALIAGVVIVYFFRIHIAVKMAEKRNRSTVGWGLFSFFISPIWAWILLALLGKYVSPED